MGETLGNNNNNKNKSEIKPKKNNKSIGKKMTKLSLAWKTQQTNCTSQVHLRQVLWALHIFVPSLLLNSTYTMLTAGIQSWGSFGPRSLPYCVKWCLIQFWKPTSQSSFCSVAPWKQHYTNSLSPHCSPLQQGCKGPWYHIPLREHHVFCVTGSLVSPCSAETLFERTEKHKNMTVSSVAKTPSLPETIISIPET